MGENKLKILIVGAGLSGSIIARELVDNNTNVSITVIDKRNHLAGNCFTKRDLQTNIMEHIYGPHIFHTNKVHVWQYINKYVKMMPFENRVKITTDKGVFSMPINLHTINQFFNQTFNPQEAADFIALQSDKSIIDPQTFEDQALKFLGKDLYYNFFYHYTKKQWGCEPTELPASILKRLPVRFNYNDNYFNDQYQGIPEFGYTEFVEKLLDHSNIKVCLSTDYLDDMMHGFDHIFYSGAIDSFYKYQFGRLGYRTVFFEKSYHDGDVLGNAVINNATKGTPYTRQHEHKHFAYWEQHDKSIVYTEYSKETEIDDEPFYPKRFESDVALYNKYKELANRDNKKFTFIGRLGTYRYLDMNVIIEETLDLVKNINYFNDK